MATYVIGDIQGCFLTFMKLLETISFDEQKDHLILLGDVVNRGTNSLEVLRFIYERQHSVSMVLGNHDILAIALSLFATKNHEHTMQKLLNAPDSAKLIDYLRKRPLIIKRDDAIFVHAGILPSVSIDAALMNAKGVEKRLQGEDARNFLSEFYEKRRGLEVRDPDVTTLYYCTLIRMCASPKTMAPYDGTLKHAPEGLTPWFMLRNDQDVPCYFGHWAALGFYRYHNYCCLDSGCVWGNQLSALRLEDQKLFRVQNAENPI